MIAKTPTPPYYAVIFTSLRTEGDNGYSDMAEKMMELAKQQDGYLGVETARDGIGITVSYWSSLQAIQRWREHSAHSVARTMGKENWYTMFSVRIAKVEKEYSFLK